MYVAASSAGSNARPSLKIISTFSMAAIWTVGQKIANNTVHIALLDTTNALVAQILDGAKGVAAGTAALRAHAERCPGCPTCLAGTGGAR